jgi:hypothetical protein
MAKKKRKKGFVYFTSKIVIAIIVSLIIFFLFKPLIACANCPGCPCHLCFTAGQHCSNIGVTLDSAFNSSSLSQALILVIYVFEFLICYAIASVIGFFLIKRK